MIWRVTNEPFEIDWNARGERRALQQAANILRMWRNEAPYLRNVGIAARVHDANAETGVALAMTEAARNLADYAPNIEVKNIFAENRPAGLYIAADVEVKAG